MLPIFLKTLPFFALIGLGFIAAKTQFFSEQATAYLTKFVFFFALSAMIFKFSASLSLAEVFDWALIIAYLCASLSVYLIAMFVAYLRKIPLAEATFEAQCAVIGNVGFLGLPMLALLLGPAAVGPVMMILAVDLIVFSSLVVILVTGSREGHLSLGIIKTVTIGLFKNPMIVSIIVGLSWSASGWTLPVPAAEFVDILAGAATPGALFAIGASLAFKSAERMSVAGWLSFCKLILHPAAVAISVLLIFPVEPYAAGVIIAAASLPVAGNIYMLAQHYGVAPARVSASILISTVISIVTVSAIIAWIETL